MIPKQPSQEQEGDLPPVVQEPEVWLERSLSVQLPRCDIAKAKARKQKV